MIVKDIIFEDFINYKKPCMTIEFPCCSFKCEKESGVQCCQNSNIAKSANIEVDVQRIVQLYINNPITQAICCQGLEPFDTVDDLLTLISAFRTKCDDDIVIYTGYKEEEISNIVHYLAQNYPNIIIKFGRFIPDQSKHYDEVLGIELASDNQYAKQIS